MTIYLDPAGPYPRPTLLPALMAVPAKEGQHQLENQATEVLAWLIDRSDAVARATCGLFLGDLSAVSGADRIGARTQISLPRPAGGTVFPDLSIDGSHAAFQLLVEVKVGSELSESLDEEGIAVQQDDVYRHAWKAQGDTGQAAIRAVGTLTRLGDHSTPDLAALRARAVSWSELRDALDSIAGRVTPEVGAVLASFVEAINVHIAVAPIDPAEIDAWLKRHKALVTTTAALLAERIGGKPDLATKTSSDYVSRYVRFTDRTGQEMRVRVFATPSGGRLNLPGHPDTLAVYLGRDGDAKLEKSIVPQLQSAGFVAQKDIWGFKLCRRHFEIPVEGEHQRLTASVAEQVAGMLDAARLLRFAL